MRGILYGLSAANIACVPLDVAFGNLWFIPFNIFSVVFCAYVAGSIR
jgi:hypothetical protein